MKKFISLFLSLAMLLTIVSVVDFSAYAMSSHGPCGSNAEYTFNSETGVLRITGTGDMTNYYERGNGIVLVSPFQNYTGIKQIIIGSGITSIGSYAFWNCGGVTSVSIPSSVTTIGASAFNGCTKLTSIDLPSVKSIGENAFYSCRLQSIYIGSKLTSLENLYLEFVKYFVVSEDNEYFSALGSVLFDKNQTTLIKYPCKNDWRTAYTIPKSVTQISANAFSLCKNLTSITIPDSLTSIGSSAFYECTSLITITIPDSVTSIGRSAFGRCTSLIGVTIPDSVTSIGGGAFYGCTRLGSITIPDNVKSIGSSAFDDTAYYNEKSNWNKGLLYISNCLIKAKNNYQFVDNGYGKCYIKKDTSCIADRAFSDCENIRYLYVDEGNANYSTEEGVLFNKNKTELIKYPVGKYEKSYDIPDSVTNIDDGAFSKCGGLGSITIPDSVTNIGYVAFYSCTNLKVVYYKGTKAEWENINIGANNSCLTDAILTFTDGIKANGNTIEINNIKYQINDDLTAVVTGYKGNSENVLIPETFEYEGYTFKVTSIGSKAFENYHTLRSVIIPNSVTSIGSNAFRDSENLISITVPDNVISIDSSAFYATGFYNTVENWKNGVLYCGNHLISAKNDVTKITVKASTVSIAKGALDNCKSLEKINILNPKCVINCTIPRTAVIGGDEDSTAEDYAQKNYMNIEYFSDCVHKYTYKVTVDATCTEHGEVRTYCEDCNKLISEAFTEFLPHTMVITTPAKAPTCTEDGYSQAGYCTVCGYQETSSVLKATGHTSVSANNSVAPTCTKDGKQNDTVCSVCHQTLTVGAIVPALGHNYETTVVAPTCTAQGYTVYKCTRCDNTYNDNYVNATGHNFGDNLKNCSTCGAVNPNYVAPTTAPVTTQPAPAPTQTPTQAPTTVAPAPVEPTTSETTTAVQQAVTEPTTQTETEVETTTKLVAKPKSAKLKKATGSKKAIALTWAKVKGVKGYQIQVATDKKFKKNKKAVTIKKQKTTKTTVKKLKAKKTYYVRIRTYKTKKVNGKSTKVYSSWSKAKTVKTK